MDSSSGGEGKPPVALITTPALDSSTDSFTALTAKPVTERRRPADDQPHRLRGFHLLYEKRIALFAILAAVPGVAFGTTLIWTHDWSRDTKISLTVLEMFLWLVLTLALLDQVVRPLQTLTNVVGALREEDYSFRARGAAPNDAMGELAQEINCAR